jgi:flagellar biosynthesis protein FliR
MALGAHALDDGYLVAALLLSIRFGVLALMAPPLGASLIPTTVRVAVVLALSASLAGTATLSRTNAGLHSINGLGPLLLAATSEAALGVAMALGLNLAFAMFTVGARIADVQVGFGMGQVFDPMTRQQLPVLTAIFNQLALVGFFVTDSHHELLRGLVFSIEAAPPMSMWELHAALPAVTKQLAQMFSLGFAMVAPVVFSLLLVEVGIGVLSRNLPQMNALVVGVPIKVMVALVVLADWIVGSRSVMERAYGTTFALWAALLQ